MALKLSQMPEVLGKFSTLTMINLCKFWSVILHSSVINNSVNSDTTVLMT